MRTRGEALRPALICAALLLAAAARAQDLGLDPQPDPAQPPPPVATPSAPAAAPAPKSLVVLPTGKTADVFAHWRARRDFLRDRDDKRADDEEQRAVALRDELAIENLFSIGGSLVREADDAIAAGMPVVALDRCRRAIEVAPAMPASHRCLARALMADSPANAKAAVLELVAAGRASLADPRSARTLTANVASVALAGVLIAAVAWALLLFVRHSALFAHDVQHLFPWSMRTWQTRLVAALLVLLPLLVQAGPLALLVTLLVAVALYASTLERGIAAVFLAGLAVSPWAAEGLARAGSFGGPGADAWMLEHGEGSPAGTARLEARLEATPDVATAVVLAHKAKREGDLARAEALYKRALDAPGAPGNAALAGIHNDLGNVFLLQGDAQKAVREYQTAVDLSESLAAPHFNLSRVLNLGGVEALDKVQAEQTRALELDRAAVDRFTGGKLQANTRANKFVMDAPIDALLGPMLANDAGLIEPIADEVRAHLAWGLPPALASLLPAAAAVLLLALGLARARLRPSGRCDRCGREVCRRCDPDARPSEHLCAQCVNVFIRRTGVDAAERIRKEHLVQAFHRRRWTLARAVGLISGGGGHVLTGYPLRGLFFLLVSGVLLASVLLWSGVAHDPIAVRTGMSRLRIAVTAAAFIAAYALFLRDLFARQRAEEA